MSNPRDDKKWTPVELIRCRNFDDEDDVCIDQQPLGDDGWEPGDRALLIHERTVEEMMRLLREASKDYWCKPGLDSDEKCGKAACQSCAINAFLATQPPPKGGV